MNKNELTNTNETTVKVVKSNPNSMENLIKNYMPAITDKGVVIPVDFENDGKTITTATLNSTNYGVKLDNNKEMPKSLVDWYSDTSTISSETKTIFKELDKARFAIRLGVVNIGKQLFRLNQSRCYKKDFSKFGLKDKSWKAFCENIIGIPVSSSYRYMDVYQLCADGKGNIDRRIVALTDTQLYALRSAGATHEHIIALLDTIENTTDISPEQIPELVEKTKLIATTEKAEKSTKGVMSQNETVVEDSVTDSASDDTKNSVTNTEKTILFKGTIKGQGAIKVPEKFTSNQRAINEYLLTSDITLPNTEHKDVRFYVSTFNDMDVIIVTDSEHKTILTYTYKK